MTRLVIFDLDGTLVNAYKAIWESLNFTLRKFGRPPVGMGVVRRCVGWGDKNFIGDFFSNAEAAKALKIYRLHHKTSLRRFSRVIPGVRSVLKALRKRGVKLAIASNRPVKFTNILLDTLALRPYFDTVACGKNKEDLKPSPKLLRKVMVRLGVSPDGAVYVGDMDIDVLAGRNAGVKTVAVCGGSSSRSELKKAAPLRVINRISDLPKII
jgi:phosphoglycolate phosphatase